MKNFLTKIKKKCRRQYIVMHIVIVAVQNLFQMMNILICPQCGSEYSEENDYVELIRNRKW